MSSNNSVEMDTGKDILYPPDHSAYTQQCRSSVYDQESLPRATIAQINQVSSELNMATMTPDSIPYIQTETITDDDLLEVVLQDIHNVEAGVGKESCETMGIGIEMEEVNNNNCVIPSTPVHEAVIPVTRKNMEGLKDNKVDRNRKNAVLAKRNRERKKAYIEHMEQQLKILQDTNEQIHIEKLHFEQLNQSLSEEKSKAECQARTLQSENTYLKSLLSSSSAANAGLVKHMLMSGSKDEIRIKQENKQLKLDVACVCLHIRKDHISAQICNMCRN